MAERDPGGAVRILLFTGQGWRRQDDAGCGHRRARRRRGSQDARRCRPTPPTRWPTRSTVELDAEPTEVSAGLFVQQVDTQRRLQRVLGGDPALPRGRARCRGIRRAARRGADRPSWCRGAAGPARGAGPGMQRTVGRSWSWTAHRPPRPCGCWPCRRRSTGTSTKVFPLERRVVRALRPLLAPAVGLPSPRPRCGRRPSGCRQQLLDVQHVLKAPRDHGAAGAHPGVRRRGGGPARPDAAGRSTATASTP